MSNKVNHRRDGQKRRSENATHKGYSCGNARDKAKGRRKWKQRGRRSLRRNGFVSMKVGMKGRPPEPVQIALGEAGVDHPFPAAHSRTHTHGEFDKRWYAALRRRPHKRPKIRGYWRDRSIQSDEA